MTIRSSLPDFWEPAQIRQVAEVIMGQAPIGTSYNEDGKGILLIAGAGDLGAKFPQPTKWTTNPTRICKPGDLIYCVRATIGEMNWADKEYCLGRGVAAIRAKEDLIDSHYLYYWLLSSRDYLNRLGTGSTFLQIRRQDIEDSPIYIPPMLEQRYIVTILKLADKLIDQRFKANEKIQQLIYAIFYEMFGDPATNPKRWKIMKLEEVCNRITDGTRQSPIFEDKGIPFLFVSNIVGGKINLNTTKYISPQTHEVLMKRCPIEIGDVLYSTVGSYGVAVVVDTDRPFAFQRHIAHIKPNNAAVNSLFLRTMLNSAYVKAQAHQRARGIAQETVNLGELGQFLVYVPPIYLQNQFADNVTTIQNIEAVQLKATQSIDILFQSLCLRAFTGELTAAWRKKNIRAVQQATIQRDIAIRLHGTHVEINDFKEGRLTQVEKDHFRQLIVEQAQLVFELLENDSQMLLSIMSQPVFNSFLDLIRPALSNYSELIIEALNQRISTFNNDLLDMLVQASEQLPEIVHIHLADVSDEPEILPLALIHQMADIATRIQKDRAQSEQIQAWRTVHSRLDNICSSLLQAAKKHSAYFLPDDLINNDIGLVEAEEGLHVLVALGFARQVQVRGRVLYRLVNPETERAVPEGLNL